VNGVNKIMDVLVRPNEHLQNIYFYVSENSEKTDPAWVPLLFLCWKRKYTG